MHLLFMVWNLTTSGKAEDLYEDQNVTLKEWLRE